MTAYKLTLRGDVQGVGFRYQARELALSLGIMGYAKNIGADIVEIVALGNDDDLGEFIKWCRVGPENARVISIDILEFETSKKYETFTIEY